MKTCRICIVFVSFLLLVSCKGFIKKGEQIVQKRIGKSIVKTTAKKTTKFSIKIFSRQVSKNMTKEIFSVFKKGKYKEFSATIKGKSKPILISKDLDLNLKVDKALTGNYDVIRFHKGNPRFVKDGLETNLGRMKRGLAPVYKDPTNKKAEWHGYSTFDLHHGGQKSDPDYFAIMGKDHKEYSSILHPKRVGSEINRQEFAAKERAPLYKLIAEDFEKMGL